jgi:hypothetical protein
VIHWLRRRMSAPTWWPAVRARVEAVSAWLGRRLAATATARCWPSRWWIRFGGWWASSPIPAAAAWWLDALDGCLERARIRVPDWCPEHLTWVALAAVLLAVDATAWRWLPA